MKDISLDDRYLMIGRLEIQNQKLQSRMKGHFVDDKSICSTCDRAHITRQASENRRRIYCTRLETVMPDDIAECNKYLGITELSLSQMGEIAMMIDPRDHSGGYI